MHTELLAAKESASLCTLQSVILGRLDNKEVIEKYSKNKTGCRMWLLSCFSYFSKYL